MKSIYRFWLILIQPADNDTILYFPIRQASLCVLFDLYYEAAIFIVLLIVLHSFLCKSSIASFINSLIFVLIFHFLLPLIDDMVNGAYSYRFHNNENVYIQHETITQSGCSDCLIRISNCLIKFTTFSLWVQNLHSLSTI
ncbi:hypothetical protein ANME2D_01983 [Candidatus Methanoperedens nitroreducens]|uniref:Uncharacterized protein n=1 Tax=Candidatus Methanoperedens nitratireducens TaxID=1392998 RepID=A0A062V3N8_9EURY|nr:hypothetical protein ANME2D_01983 [Candidatus Methanoperedens nitroreducens]